MIAWEYIFAAAAIFCAGVIRGYSGFGFAIISALNLSLVFPPTLVTPVILCLDLVASTWLLAKVRTQVDWKGLKMIGVGALLTLPLGSLTLITISADHIRLFISGTVFVLCAALLLKRHPMKSRGTVVTVGVGMLSGFLSGMAALGGPPVVLFYFSSDKSASVSRASMIAFFLIVDGLTLISSACCGLVNYRALTLFGCLAIPLIAGLCLGTCLFGKFSDQVDIRKHMILLLMSIALATLVKGVFF